MITAAVTGPGLGEPGEWADQVYANVQRTLAEETNAEPEQQSE
jgi:hypothetical protein